MSALPTENLRRAVAALEASVREPVVSPRDLSGIVKNFEIAYELGWKGPLLFRIDEKCLYALAVFVIHSV